MLSQAVRFPFCGITLGAICAPVARGSTLIFNASHVIDFAQGEFVTIGGMTTVFLVGVGMPMP